MKVKEDFGSIISQEDKTLSFKNNKELEKYYENKWKIEGYSKGYVLNDVPISEMFHKGRLDCAFKNLNPKPEETILDAGCGNGALSERIAPLCKKVCAIDIAKSSFNKEILKKYKNVEFKKMNVEKVSFKDEFFDKIVCIETIEHVLDYNKTLSEFYRTLKKGGTLVISYPIMDNTPLSKFELFWGIRKKFNISEHLTEWNYKQTVKIIESKGFKFVKSEGIVLDIGIMARLKRINTFFTRKITDFQLSIKCFPKNSAFVVFVFKKE